MGITSDRLLELELVDRVVQEPSVAPTAIRLHCRNVVAGAWRGNRDLAALHPDELVRLRGKNGATMVNSRRNPVASR